MGSIVGKVAPSITNSIRADHASVLATFHQYEADTPSPTKQALVETACTALEVHAQLEEEIFYPALRKVAGDNSVLEKSVPEHDDMRRLIARLRRLSAVDATYDLTFMALMRDVLHHVADEETVILPEAERLLADRLGELGAQMGKRRIELIGPRIGKLLLNKARIAPLTTALLATGIVAGAGYLVTRTLRSQRF